jgi:membrane-bound lytic murein transglycosylase MltF
MRYFALLFSLLIFLSACQESVSAVEDDAVASTSPDNDESVETEKTPGGPEGEPDTVSLEDLQSQLGLEVLTQPWKGDLDGMIERRVIRVLTVYGLGRYFLDGPEEKGFTYEMFKQYEKSLNKEQKTGPLKIHVLFVPVARDQLIPGLLAGRGDIASAGMTITSERSELVDFSNPMSKKVQELLVTGPSAPEINSLDDLSGQRVDVRVSSSYHDSLQTLSQQLQDAGKDGIDIRAISEALEDEDLLEMVNAGLLPWVVVDSYKAGVWKDVFDKLTVREDLVLRDAGFIGYAFRKDSPVLAASLNNFVKDHKQGSLLGNMLVNRYFRDFDWVGNALAADDYGRFKNVVDIFQKYGDQYGMDFLMVAAQGYQESRLDQSARSGAGAIGIMQLLPTTAADKNVGIPDISDEESNIHAGIKYLDFIRDRYFNDPAIDPVNQTLLAFAAYNAGPARVSGLRKKAEQQGLDPNQWFNNVEVVAAKEIGRETVQYVANIYKYYISYRMTTIQQTKREAARKKEGID